MRLIDADKLISPDGKSEKVLIIGAGSGKTVRMAYELLKDKVNAAPTVNAVLVVRCRDCINAVADFNYTGELVCKKTGALVPFDGFCHQGKLLTNTFDGGKHETD